MDKEEFLKMAWKHSICTSSQHKEFMHDGLFAFINEILERAAVEFTQDHREFFGHEIQEIIRNLKVTNQ